MNRCFYSLLLAAVGGSLVLPATSLAQIEEIVVTAQKREENLRNWAG